MASSFTDPYSFLPESDISSDALSSSASIFYHMEFEDLEANINSQNKIHKPKYDFYNHIQTIHLDEETLIKLAPHRQPSKFTWATSFQISEQSVLFAIFIPFGLIIWKSKQPRQQLSLNEKESEFYEIKPVEPQKAIFIDCINSQSLIFTYKKENILYVIHDAGKINNNQIRNDDEIIKKVDVSDTIRTFCQLSPEKALIITNGNSAIIFDVPSLTITKTYHLYTLIKLIPFRNQNICDSVIVTTSNMPSEYDDNDETADDKNFVISASYFHLSVFDDANNENESFALQNSLNTVIGKPKLISVIGPTAFLIIRNEKKDSNIPGTSNFTFGQISDIFDRESSFRPIRFDTNENIVTIIGIEKDVCCVLTTHYLHLIIISDISFQFSLVVSKSFNDFVFTGSLISDHTISVMTAHEGNHIFEILPYEQLIRLIPYQSSCILYALHLFQEENENQDIDHVDLMSILEKYDIDEEAFYELDKKKITSLSHYTAIQQFLKIHLDLVKLFYTYMNKKNNDRGMQEENDKLKSINEFEFNAYNIICFNEAVSFIGNSESFELDVLRNAITDHDVHTIFNFIRSDITSRQYQLIDFLINMANSCYKDHYLPNQDVYISTLKCHPEIKKLINEFLQSFKGCKKLISDHLDQYAQLCSIAFLVFDDDERQYKKQIEYVMELFSLDGEYKERALDCIEQVALDYDIHELMALILHETQLFDEKCNLYHDKFGDRIIMPILNYLLDNCWMADILDIGEIPEWRIYVTELLMKSDTLYYALHLITEEGDELGKASVLLWEAISQGIGSKTFSLDEAACFCSIALLCCTVKLNEDPDQFDHLQETKQQIQDQFMLLELQKTSRIGDKNTVLSPEELIDYFIDQKDYVVALSVYSCSTSRREENENAIRLSKILSLLATSWREPLAQGSLEQILVESRALEKVPNGLFEILENELSHFDKRNVMMEVVRSASNRRVELSE